MEKFILDKYKLKKNKSILRSILKYGDLMLIDVTIRSGFPIVIEYLIELIYNTSCKKHRDILKILNNIYSNSNTDIILNNNKDYRIIMLSSDSTVSGSNLNNAEEVIFLDPVYGDKQHRLNTEKQAIGKWCFGLD